MGRSSEKGIVPILALVIIVVVIGAGLIVLYYKNNYQKPADSASQESQIPLSIESPVEGTVITDNQVLVKGKTSPNATVVFYSDEQENSVDSDTSGNFEGTIALARGINSLTVTAFAENGDEKSLTLDIVNDTK